MGGGNVPPTRILFTQNKNYNIYVHQNCTPFSDMSRHIRKGETNQSSLRHIRKGGGGQVRDQILIRERENR